MVVPGQSQRIPFSSFFEAVLELPDAPGGKSANDKFGESDAHAALARRSQASKPN
jgi:hypothetical protein